MLEYEVRGRVGGGSVTEFSTRKRAPGAIEVSTALGTMENQNYKRSRVWSTEPLLRELQGICRSGETSRGMKKRVFFPDLDCESSKRACFGMDDIKAALPDKQEAPPQYSIVRYEPRVLAHGALVDRTTPPKTCSIIPYQRLSFLPPKSVTQCTIVQLESDDECDVTMEDDD
jgi:hypothetical protein